MAFDLSECGERSNRDAFVADGQRAQLWDRFQVDDIPGREPMELELIEQVAPASHERRVSTVTRREFDGVVERSWRQQFERRGLVHSKLPHVTSAFRRASARRTRATR